jgi:hypothetical protein
LPRRWQETEARVKMLEALVADIKWEDNSVEENRYDIVSELMEKALQGFEINEEHEVSNCCKFSNYLFRTAKFRLDIA